MFDLSTENNSDEIPVNVISENEIEINDSSEELESSQTSDEICWARRCVAPARSPRPPRLERQWAPRASAATDHHCRAGRRSFAFRRGP